MEMEILNCFALVTIKTTSNYKQQQQPTAITIIIVIKAITIPNKLSHKWSSSLLSIDKIKMASVDKKKSNELDVVA